MNALFQYLQTETDAERKARQQEMLKQIKREQAGAEDVPPEFKRFYESPPGSTMTVRIAGQSGASGR